MGGFRHTHYELGQGDLATIGQWCRELERLDEEDIVGFG